MCEAFPLFRNLIAMAACRVSQRMGTDGQGIYLVQVGPALFIMLNSIFPWFKVPYKLISYLRNANLPAWSEIRWIVIYLVYISFSN